MRNFWIIARMGVNCAFPLLLIFSMTAFRCSRRRAAAIFSGCAALSGAIAVALFFAVGQERMMRVFAFVLGAPLLVALLVLTRDRLSQIFFNFFTAVNALYFVSIIGRILGGMNETRIWPDALARAALYGLIVLVFRRRLVEPYHYLAEQMRRGWGVISVIPFLFFALVMFLGLYPTVRTDHFAAVLFLYVILCFVYYVIYQVFRNTYDLLLTRQSDQMLSVQLAMLRNQIAVLEQGWEETRIMRHDARHYLSNLAALVCAGRNEEALEYMGRLEKIVGGARREPCCENPVLDALLSYYIGVAKSEGVEVRARLDIPRALPVDEVELSVVVANALENACNACRALRAGERRLEITCVSRPRFVLEVANSCAGEVFFGPDGLPQSSREGHGLGMRSIAAFARRTGAVLDCSVRGGMFRLRVALTAASGEAAPAPAKNPEKNERKVCL